MKPFFRRYLNEIVGLTVMALMTVALVAGQTRNGTIETELDGPRDVIEIRLTRPD